MVEMYNNFRKLLIEIVRQNVVVTFPSFCFACANTYQHYARTLSSRCTWISCAIDKQVRHMACAAMSTENEPTVYIGDMRLKYHERNDIFTEDQLVSKEPIGQFKAWFKKASENSQIQEANAMFVGTATKNGFPSVRAALLKSYGTEGFTFYTNYNSRKGREIAENPHVALTFYWEPLRRSVRIEGTAVKTSAEESDAYFLRRPYNSQISAMTSQQSSVIANRDTLLEKEKKLREQFPEGQTKRPDWWGGFTVVPHSIEFWQGQSDRLHDRVRFRRPKTDEKIDNVLTHEGEDGWVYERLSP